MKLYKKTAINLFYALTFFAISGCQSSSTKNNLNRAIELDAQSIKGSVALSTYKSESKVTVLDKGKVSRKYKDSVQFKIDRRTINVSENGDMQFKIVTSDKKGNIELKDLAYPEPGQELYEMVDKAGKHLVVKDMMIGSIYYISRVALPSQPVKPGDTWSYRARWISEATGWPFEISIISKLESWSDCDGLMCATVSFTGEVILPEDFPLKATLESDIKGKYHYSPVSYEVLWGESKSKEEFYIEPIDKRIKVKSESCSMKDGYKKKC